MKRLLFILLLISGYAYSQCDTIIQIPQLEIMPNSDYYEADVKYVLGQDTLIDKIKFNRADLEIEITTVNNMILSHYGLSDNSKIIRTLFQGIDRSFVSEKRIELQYYDSEGNQNKRFDNTTKNNGVDPNTDIWTISELQKIDSLGFKIMVIGKQKINE